VERRGQLREEQRAEQRAEQGKEPRGGLWAARLLGVDLGLVSVHKGSDCTAAKLLDELDEG
jgi:hypothetical protein